MKEWSGRWDSNPRLDLGKVPYYPYTTTAPEQENFITSSLRRQDCIDVEKNSTQPAFRNRTVGFLPLYPMKPCAVWFS